ncbi:MAG: nucleotide exchange factor GrpE [Verrucomicrobia bacterium]|nr:MAG: nucleotide exchange factor GrpE [Verrucomicrobiota bacterium]
MQESDDLKVAKWPFFLGDAVMLGLAFFINWQGRLPLTPMELGACVVCVVLGAALAVTPFVLEYRVWMKARDHRALGSTVEKLQQLETVAAQISSATNHWDLAQNQAEKTSNAAQEIADRMAAELKDFTAVMQKLNESEKGALRLEVEKLHRAENDWLQVLVRILDHVYALHQGAERSRQTGVIAQISAFQNAVRDAARRVGLTPYAAAAGETFDAERHQSAGDEKPANDATVGETLATGYTYQGRLLRPALVRLAASQAISEPPAPASPDVPPPVAEQPQLSLQAAGEQA